MFGKHGCELCHRHIETAKPAVMGKSACDMFPNLGCLPPYVPPWDAMGLRHVKEGN